MKSVRFPLRPEPDLKLIQVFCLIVSHLIENIDCKLKKKTRKYADTQNFLYAAELIGELFNNYWVMSSLNSNK